LIIFSALWIGVADSSPNALSKSVSFINKVCNLAKSFSGSKQ
jgi:hypothetical protein